VHHAEHSATDLPDRGRNSEGDDTAQRVFAAIDAPLDFERPFLAVLAAEEGLVDILPLPSHLDAPRPDLSLVKVATVCALVCTGRRTGAKIVASWRRKRVHMRRPDDLRLR
jgi:hypothetical protein